MSYLNNPTFKIVKHSKTAFVFINEHNKIISANEAALSFFLYTEKELIDAPVETILQFDKEDFLNKAEGQEIKALALTAGDQKIQVQFTKSEFRSADLQKIISLSIEKCICEHEAYQLGKDYLINSTSDMIWSFGRNYQLTAANISFISLLKNITGISFKTGDNLAAHQFLKRFIDEWQPEIQRAFKGQRVRELKYIPAFLEYGETWIELSGYPIMNDCGNILGITCHASDRTESILAQKQLQESEANLAQAQKLARLGNWSKNLITGKVNWSKQMFEIFDISPCSQQHTLALFLRRVHKDDQKRLIQHIKTTGNTAKPFVINYRITTPDGTEKTIEQIGYGEKDETGSPVKIFGTARDISDAVEAERALRLSNERYYYMAKATQDAICDWDMVNDTITRTGDGFKNSFGYNNDQAANGKSFIELIHPDDVTAFMELQKYVSQDKERNYLEREFRILKADGQYAYAYHRAFIVRNKEGEPVRMIGVLQNITQRVESLHKIKRLQENTNALINNTDSIIWSIDKNFKIITANEVFNRKFEAAMGKKAEEGDDVFIAPTKQLIQYWKRRYQKALNGKQVSFKHYEVDKETKRTNYFIITLNPIINKAGITTGIACFAKNITDLIKANNKLQESQELFNKIFELSPQPMGLYDYNSLKFNEVNQAAKKLFGYSRDEFLSLKVTDIVAENIEFKRQFDTPGIVKHRDKNGKVIDVEIFNSELNIDGKKHILAVGIDQTQKLRTDKKVNKAIIKAQENERYEIGSELHDNICQLLASSKMRMSMFKEDIPKNKIELYNQSREYLVAALEEIRNLSHRLAPSFFNEKTLEEAFSKLFHSFDIEGKYQLFTHYDENLSEWEITTEMKLNLYRILQEQLRNIINYANATSIEIDVVIHKNRLKMRIADDGIGFEVKNVKRGIGLSNMRRRTEIFDGGFHLASTPGNGTEITVDLPLMSREQ